MMGAGLRVLALPALPRTLHQALLPSLSYLSFLHAYGVSGFAIFALVLLGNLDVLRWAVFLDIRLFPPIFPAYASLLKWSSDFGVSFYILTLFS
jgi:hypothetical protein